MRPLVFLLLFSFLLSAEAELKKSREHTLFQNSSTAVYNIPNLVRTKKGSLLAVIEKRPSGAMQAQKLVLRRSTDRGKTWSEEIAVADKGENILVNSAHMVDRKSGRIFVLVNYFAKGYFVGRAAAGYESEQANRQYICQSDDDGQTWSELREITRGVKPEKANFSIINAGGKGIELKKGKHRGRFLVPVWVNDYKTHQSYAIYSDDRGKTWQRGEIAEKSPEAQGNSTESQFVELSTGGVLMLTRTTGGQRFRRQAISKDGGLTWSKMVYTKLFDPSCQASFSVRTLKGKRVWFLVHPNSQAGRVNGSVTVSFDEGETWPINKSFEEGSFGYSGSYLQRDGSLAIFYEADNRCVFKFLCLSVKEILKKDAEK